MVPYRNRSRGSRRSYSRTRDIGYERARQHIEDAQALTRELGGTDEDVKRYFFALPPAQLASVLDAYEQSFGASARSYAEETMPRWRRGDVSMSGTVAERLFNLLPPRMPLSEKYKLTESLWQHFGPRSKKRLRMGLEADPDEVTAAARDHLEQVVASYQIPVELERRFNWLSAGDVGVKQHLLNHLREQERSLVVEGARLQLPVMLEHLKSEAGENTHRMAQTLVVGRHELELLIDRDAVAIVLEEWKPPVVARTMIATASGGGDWMTWAFVIGAIILIAQCTGN